MLGLPVKVNVSPHRRKITMIYKILVQGSNGSYVFINIFYIHIYKTKNFLQLMELLIISNNTSMTRYHSKNEL